MNRRGALRALGALTGAVATPAFGANDEASVVTAPIRAFYDALLDAMRRAKALGVHGRYDALAPVIRATFELAAMTRISVGPRWNSIPPEQQQALIDGFTRMTIATYASRFDGYSGERFEVDPAVETRKTGSVVHTRLVQSNGEPIAINYLMRHSAAGWQVVDVYLTGVISELATRRSEFGAILDAGGPAKLIDTLKRQTDQLLRPAPAR
ncbi:MAG TPA: ABC transporter substrate-binding protein [Casimicrobiaceae bacterium]|nr:ABC transporter substrate-binding protein [Casimicrobiaceae bacterium]